MSMDATIMAALKTRLETIKTANGYQSNIGKTVFIWRTTALAPADVPAILIADTSIEHDGLIGVTRNIMTVDIIAVLSGAASLADARAARADIKKALNGYSMAGVNSIRMVKSAIEMKQFEELVAGATAQLLIEYDTTPTEI